MSATYDITIYCGRDYTLDVAWQTLDGNPVDLTGYQIILTIKKLLTDLDANILYQAPAPSSSNLSFGSFSFWIPKGTTKGFTPGTGVYDIATNSPTKYAYTPMSGAVNFVQSVLQTVTP